MGARAARPRVRKWGAPARLQRAGGPPVLLGILAARPSEGRSVIFVYGIGQATGAVASLALNTPVWPPVAGVSLITAAPPYTRHEDDAPPPPALNFTTKLPCCASSSVKAMPSP